jgi:hypothetical protein
MTHRPSDSVVAPRRLSRREVQPLWVLAALSTLGIATVAFLRVLLVILDLRWYAALAELSSGSILEAVQDMEVPSAAGDRVTAVASVSTSLDLLLRLVYFGTGVAFVAWHYRARGNLDGLGITGFRRGRGWVIGAWLLPIVSLVMPYGMVAEVSRASHPAFPRQRPARQGERAEPLLACWWAAWVAMSVAWLLYDVLTWRLFDGDPPTAELVETRGTVLLADWATAVLTVLAALLAMLVLLRVTRRQHALTKPLAARAVGTPV